MRWLLPYNHLPRVCFSVNSYTTSGIHYCYYYAPLDLGIKVDETHWCSPSTDRLASHIQHVAILPTGNSTICITFVTSSYKSPPPVLIHPVLTVPSVSRDDADSRTFLLGQSYTVFLSLIAKGATKCTNWPKDRYDFGFQLIQILQCTSLIFRHVFTKQ